MLRGADLEMGGVTSPTIMENTICKFCQYLNMKRTPHPPVRERFPWNPVKKEKIWFLFLLSKGDKGSRFDEELQICINLTNQKDAKLSNYSDILDLILNQAVFSSDKSLSTHIVVVLVRACPLICVWTLHLVVNPIEGIHILFDCVLPSPFNLADKTDHSNCLEEEQKEECSR